MEFCGTLPPPGRACLIIVGHFRQIAALFKVIYRAARTEKLLVVIDEFPWLLGPSAAHASQALSAIQAVMEEERDSSKIKLILCGSHVGQMEALFGERNPMHGRLVRAEVRPLPFEEALQSLPSHDPVTAFERYAIAGGMPRYLAKPHQRGDRRSRNGTRQGNTGSGVQVDGKAAGSVHRDRPRQLQDPRATGRRLQDR